MNKWFRNANSLYGLAYFFSLNLRLGKVRLLSSRSSLGGHRDPLSWPKRSLILIYVCPENIPHRRIYREKIRTQQLCPNQTAINTLTNNIDKKLDHHSSRFPPFVERKYEPTKKGENIPLLSIPALHT